MRKIAELLVDRRRYIFLFMILLTLVSAVLIPRVKVNTDLTRYLPDSSRMKQGIDIMAQEFSDLPEVNTVRVMFHDLPDDKKETILEELKETPYVESVSFEPGDRRYEKDGYTLYILNFSIGFFSLEMTEAESYIKTHYSGQYEMTYCLDKTNQQGVPLWIFALALVLLLVILMIFSESWIEPFLFLFAMGIAVVINMGSCVLLPYVSEITWSIGAILQLALSIDYSVILISRYRQELDRTPDRESAMKAALQRAFSSIAGSAFTTIVGFLVLVFMSFKIGRDMGIIMAKGVLLSMVSILTILPFLILACDSLIRKTHKRVLSLKMNAVSRFSYRYRYAITVFFVLFFALIYVLKGNTQIAFTLIAPNDIDPVFPKENQIVVLYENADEDGVMDVIPHLEEEDCVNSVMAWPNTLGKSYTAEELSKMIDTMGADAGFDLSPDMIRMVYSLYFGGDKEGRLTIFELLDYVRKTVSSNMILQNLLSDEMKASLDDAPALLEEAGRQLKGPEHSIMVVSTSLPAESEETDGFMQRLETLCGENLSGTWYLIGNTPMATEMVETFSGELNLLTLLTAAAIFLVVLITFRSLAIPVILVLLIQSAVYTTIVLINLQGTAIYYLALLIVQSILMGATIDYAILLANYYRELRTKQDIKDALSNAYNYSLHTILTSGSIVICVTAIVGYAFSDPSVRQIVHTISKGAACSVILILFVLPGLLCALDRLVKHS